MDDREYGKGRPLKLDPKDIEEAKKLAESELFSRQGNYVQTFVKDSPVVEAVLTDLAEFCHAHESCFHDDPRIHAMYEGRREVWLRIARNINLSSQDLWNLYTNRKF